jgi:hypothetical protein
MGAWSMSQLYGIKKQGTQGARKKKFLGLMQRHTAVFGQLVKWKASQTRMDIIMHNSKKQIRADQLRTGSGDDSEATDNDAGAESDTAAHDNSSDNEIIKWLMENEEYNRLAYDLIEQLQARSFVFNSLFFSSVFMH